MNDEIKKKLIEFDIKIDELWELMEQIQLDHKDSFDELPFSDKLAVSFNKLKDAIAFTIPKEVDGISIRESAEKLILNNSKEPVVDAPTCTHIYRDGKWYLASELPKE